MTVATILLIDDNPLESELMREAMGDADNRISIYAVENAVQAFAFLSKQNGFAHMPLPDLLVVDLRMPIVDGLRTIQIIKDTPAWRTIPVVLVSSCAAPEEREKAMALGADDVIAKPVQWADLTEMAQRLLNNLPRQLRPTKRMAD